MIKEILQTIGFFHQPETFPTFGPSTQQDDPTIKKEPIDRDRTVSPPPPDSPTMSSLSSSPTEYVDVPVTTYPDVDFFRYFMHDRGYALKQIESKTKTIVKYLSSRSYNPLYRLPEDRDDCFFIGASDYRSLHFARKELLRQCHNYAARQKDHLLTRMFADFERRSWKDIDRLGANILDDRTRLSKLADKFARQKRKIEDLSDLVSDLREDVKRLCDENQNLRTLASQLGQETLISMGFEEGQIIA